MTEPGTAVAKVSDAPRPLANANLGSYATEANFALAMRVAKSLAASDLVPEAYKGKEANCLIALDIAHHQGVSPLTVMQNLHIIHGRPSWGSSYVIGALNSCGRFSPIRFNMKRNGTKRVEITTWTGPKGNRTPKRETVEIDDWTCSAYATELATGERIEGPTVSIEMATIEGWVDKAESKWRSMPDLMLRYRAAAFFGRLYAPDILMGMQTAEEVFDVVDRAPAPAKSAGAASLQEAIEADRGKVDEGVAMDRTDAERAKDDGEVRAHVEAAIAAAKPAQTREEVAALKDEPAVKLEDGRVVPDRDPKPEPSKYVQRATLKRENGGTLTPEEEEAIRDHALDLEAWNARQPKGDATA